METDFLVLKGNEAAGTISTELTLKESFKIMRDRFPSLDIIPTGGITCSEDIKYYIDKGASAVGIGSLFACSIESRISDMTKLKIVSSSKDDLSMIKNKNQQGILFKEIETDNDNNTNSLKLGIKGTQIGHIFMGKSVDSINDIKSVKEIVERLTK
jgi:NAD(P)H-dependent flavin oxidoreductase YrpB (nitropropane dioxygenase family)